LLDILIADPVLPHNLEHLVEPALLLLLIVALLVLVDEPVALLHSLLDVPLLLLVGLLPGPGLIALLLDEGAVPLVPVLDLVERGLDLLLDLG
jgi:hypothetical protein